VASLTCSFLFLPCEKSELILLVIFHLSFIFFCLACFRSYRSLSCLLSCVSSGIDILTFAVSFLHFFLSSHFRSSLCNFPYIFIFAHRTIRLVLVFHIIFLIIKWDEIQHFQHPSYFVPFSIFIFFSHYPFAIFSVTFYR